MWIRVDNAENSSSRLWTGQVISVPAQFVSVKEFVSVPGGHLAAFVNSVHWSNWSDISSRLPDPLSVRSNLAYLDVGLP
jgi:hypothetical protein